MFEKDRIIRGSVRVILDDHYRDFHANAPHVVFCVEYHTGFVVVVERDGNDNPVRAYAYNSGSVKKVESVAGDRLLPRASNHLIKKEE